MITHVLRSAHTPTRTGVDHTSARGGEAVYFAITDRGRYKERSTQNYGMACEYRNIWEVSTTYNHTVKCKYSTHNYTSYCDGNVAAIGNRN